MILTNRNRRFSNRGHHYLRIILLRDNGLISPLVKQRIISIHDKAVGLQLNLKHFPEKGIIREVANTSEEIIQYLFSQQNFSDYGSIGPTVRLLDQLGKLAMELDSTVGYVVDYCKESDVAVGFGEDLSDSTAATSSSSSIYPPTGRDDMVGFDEDVLQMKDWLISISSNREILPIVEMGGLGKSKLATHIYNDPLINQHFDNQAWVTISQDYSIPSIVSQLLASLKGKVDRVGREHISLKFTKSYWGGGISE
ncbi:probable disease resistance protein RF9 [Salvia hispanica]|uniref:probable disease resistance protein RF9 n=1 Tax=Salvia hispanica TaxID=49212 RepID=UPI002008F199|nr:probable disease resistance protein RF9 [Salvia hispanica]